jgi:hypothetical protein
LIIKQAGYPACFFSALCMSNADMALHHGQSGRLESGMLLFPAGLWQLPKNEKAGQ